MPNIDTVNGVKINVYPNDHVPPHVHALYGEREALIVIATRKIYAGSLPKVKLQIAQKFVKKNEQELLDIFYQLNPKTKLK
jgi:uncharacterized protein DUF4160